MGYMGRPGSAEKQFMNVHGAGAQRSDPKSGDPTQFPQGRGPQGDDIRIYNYVRCVRGGGVVKHNPGVSGAPRARTRAIPRATDNPPAGAAGEWPPPPPPEGAPPPPAGGPPPFDGGPPF